MKSINGKIVLRTVLVTAVIVAILAALAIMSMRSLASDADNSLAEAREWLPETAIEPMEGLAGDIDSASSRLTTLLLLAGVVGVAASGGLAFMSAKSVTAPIERLRQAAAKSAAALEGAGDSDTAPELPNVVVESGDEIEELSRSFHNMQQTAASLANKQTQVHVDNASRLTSLGRRTHQLLARQMSVIDAMEKDETSADNLKRLFQIDHLATQIQRSAESVLVLSGEGSPWQLAGSVSVHRVIQAAAGQIEHFERIAVARIEDAAVDGQVAHDLAHLLAELLENATEASPDHSAATVTGHSTEQGYLLEISDDGRGMSAEAIASANALFAGSGPGPDAKGLGHEVIARLAQRHGFAVQLADSPNGGVTARLLLPPVVLSADDAGDAAPMLTTGGGAPAPAQPPAAPMQAAQTDVPSEPSSVVESSPVAQEETDRAFSAIIDESYHGTPAESFEAADAVTYTEVPAPPPMPVDEPVVESFEAADAVTYTEVPAPPPAMPVDEQPVMESFEAADAVTYSEVQAPPPAMPVDEQPVMESFEAADAVSDTEEPAPPMMPVDELAEEASIEDMLGIEADEVNDTEPAGAFVEATETVEDAPTKLEQLIDEVEAKLAAEDREVDTDDERSDEIADTADTEIEDAEIEDAVQTEDTAADTTADAEIEDADIVETEDSVNADIADTDDTATAADADQVVDRPEVRNDPYSNLAWAPITDTEDGSFVADDLTPKQRAAIEWATEMPATASLAAGPVPAATAGPVSRSAGPLPAGSLRSGPIEAGTIIELDRVEPALKNDPEADD